MYKTLAYECGTKMRVWLVLVAILAMQSTACQDHTAQEITSPPDGEGTQKSESQTTIVPKRAVVNEQLPIVDVPTLTPRVDGVADDWVKVSTVLSEEHKAGKLPENTGFAIQNVSIACDKKYLYFLLLCNPSIKEYWPTRPENREDLFDLFLDTDSDPGSGGDVHFDPHANQPGYDVRLAVQFARYGGLPKDKPVVHFRVYDPLGGQAWRTRTLMEDKVPISSLDSFEDAPDANETGQPKPPVQEYALIAHGSDGIELAVPLNVLDMRPETRIRALLVIYQSNWYQKPSLRGLRPVALQLR